MEQDGNISDRLRKRFNLFGQFFKGFIKSKVSEGDGPSPSGPGIRADQKVYDDTSKFGDKKVLEFETRRTPIQNDPVYSNDVTPPTSPGHRSFPGTTIIDPFDFFGSTRSLLEEFEHTMKIFDDFAYILQQPITGQAEFPLLGIAPDLDTNIAEVDDEPDVRYFKFFGKGNPNSFSNVDEPSETSTIPQSEENCRDLMLKPSPNELQGSHRPAGSGTSLLGKILESIWDARTADRDPNSVVRGGPFSGGEDSQNGGYFTFSSQESSLKSDGSNVCVTATKIRETPEGREIITYKTNGDGVTEQTREFIPRKDLPNLPNSSFGGPGIFPPRL